MAHETFFTADTHFGHAGIVSMCNRPFGSIDEHDEALVARWNERVRKNDFVFHVGDFAHKLSAERTREVFDRLNGRKFLIIGNHDPKKTLDLPWEEAPLPAKQVYVPGEKLPIILNHYAQRVWNRSHYGTVHLYGHSHGALPGIGRSLDVGVDCWDYRPVTLDELRPTLERQQSELELRPQTEMVVPADFPELSQIVRNRDPHRPIGAEDAFTIYEQNWRFIRPNQLVEHERRLLLELASAFGGDFSLGGLIGDLKAKDGGPV